MTFSPSGDLNNSATNRAYLDAGSHDLGDYATGTMVGRFEPGGVGTHVLQGGPRPALRFDNRSLSGCCPVKSSACSSRGPEKEGSRRGRALRRFCRRVSGKRNRHSAPQQQRPARDCLRRRRYRCASWRVWPGGSCLCVTARPALAPFLKTLAKKSSAALIVELPLPAGKSRRVDGDLFTLVNEYLSKSLRCRVAGVEYPSRNDSAAQAVNARWGDTDGRSTSQIGPIAEEMDNRSVRSTTYRVLGTCRVCPTRWLWICWLRRRSRRPVSRPRFSGLDSGLADALRPQASYRNCSWLTKRLSLRVPLHGCWQVSGPQLIHQRHPAYLCRCRWSSCAADRCLRP